MLAVWLFTWVPTPEPRSSSLPGKALPSPQSFVLETVPPYVAQTAFELAAVTLSQQGL